MKFHSNIYGWEYVWREFAEERGGQVVFEDTHSTSPVIVALHVPVGRSGGLFTVTPFLPGGKRPFESSSASLTFEDTGGLDFSLRTETAVDQIHKAFGLQDIIVGDPALDQRFIIQANDVNRVRDLLSDYRVKDLILLNPTSVLRTVRKGTLALNGHNLPAGRSALLYCQDQLMDKFEQLETAFNILARLAHLILVPADVVGAPAMSSSLPEAVAHLGRLHSPLLDS